MTKGKRTNSDLQNTTKIDQTNLKKKN